MIEIEKIQDDDWKYKWKKDKDKDDAKVVEEDNGEEDYERDGENVEERY